jgi:hypothetical protein
MSATEDMTMMITTKGLEATKFCTGAEARRVACALSERFGFDYDFNIVRHQQGTHMAISVIVKDVTVGWLAAL